MNALNPVRKLAARPSTGCCFTLSLVAGLLAMVTMVRADPPPTFLFQINSNNVPGTFWPMCVAMDSSNNIYVTEDNGRILKFTSGGVHLAQWDGPFYAPFGLAVDSDSNVYLVEELNYRVDKFDRNGNYLAQWGSSGSGNGHFDEPLGVAVDSSNNVYVADSGNFRVQKFDSNGKYLTQWGNSGAGNGQFNWDYGLAVDSSNNVYVTDIDNDRVEKFTGDGVYLAQWGTSGRGNGQFSQPAGIAVDSSNNIYVTDLGNSRVQKFDANGSYLIQWGTAGSGIGQFRTPVGVAVDRTGNYIYVCDSTQDGRIQVFANNTNIVPPIITKQPVSQSVLAGLDVTFSVGVAGAMPFAYQWTSNNVVVSGGTNATFKLTKVGRSANGTYSVLVTNRNGSASGGSAALNVLPSLATTQPASGLSATGAVLNGFVTVGLVETVAWFDWGKDANYGNIAGATIVPGNNGSNKITAALSGLNGDIYHYRIVAANAAGFVYGDDQSFTVGLPPDVATLSALSSTNGWTLNAAVNPGGWDTTVYFLWGVAGFITNSSPFVDVGAGSASLNAKSFITGLAPAAQYGFQAMASNYLGTLPGEVSTFYTPPFVSVPAENWDSVASSADGSVLVAVSNPGPIYLSTNSGAVWTQANAPTSSWQSVACSADGTKIIAGSFFSVFLTSQDAGATWTQATNPPFYGRWLSIASSGDGTKLAAVFDDLSGVHMSTNSGVDWTFQSSGLSRDPGFTYVASSADGRKLVLASGYYGAGPIYTSTNSGSDWTQAADPPLAHWYSVASSADGKTLLACASPGNVYLSTDAGVTWIQSSLPTNNWSSVAESADGTKMVAVANSLSAILGTGDGGIFTSTNSGVTWISNGVPSGAWSCAAMSADGNEFIAAIGYPSTDWGIYQTAAGGIYRSQSTPSPKLNLAASDNNTAVSWIIPSLDFTLQRSPNLLSWAAVTNPPVLNLTNLQNQVVLPPQAGNRFFRLMR